MNSEQLAERICCLLDEKKATDITVMKVGHLTIVADYFVIATARSTAQAKAIYETSTKNFQRAKGLNRFALTAPAREDGSSWITAELSCIFSTTTRAFYTVLTNSGRTATTL